MKKYLWMGLGTFIIASIGGMLFFKKNIFKEENPVIRVGYFHGGRTMLLYRALVNNYFENEKLTAYFVTKQLRAKTWDTYDKTGNERTFLGKQAGKATGIELTDLLLEKKVELSAIGEAAFIKACSLGKPIMAIAQLGSDELNEGGHSIVLRKGIKIKKPKDLEKLIWGTRRSSGGDDIFLKEFLYQQGVDLKKVKIISGIDDDKISEYLKDGTVQGAYHHLMMVRNDEMSGFIYTYRKLDWVHPGISQAVAIVSKDYLQQNRETLKKFIRAYMKRIAFEKALPKEERQKKRKSKKGVGYQISLYELEMNHKGMNLPQYPAIPIIRKDLTDDAVEMFYRHKFIDNKVNADKCYDNSLVMEVARELYDEERIKKELTFSDLN